MSFWRTLLTTAAGAVGGIFGGPAGSALAAAGANALTGLIEDAIDDEDDDQSSASGSGGSMGTQDVVNQIGRVVTGTLSGIRVPVAGAGLPGSTNVVQAVHPGNAIAYLADIASAAAQAGGNGGQRPVAQPQSGQQQQGGQQQTGQNQTGAQPTGQQQDVTQNLIRQGTDRAITALAEHLGR